MWDVNQPDPAAPDQAAIRRFTQTVTRLTGNDGARLGLAVSGGPDSLAMLLMAHAAFPLNIAAATVDHGLRPEAADEAEFVARICADLGIMHSILKPLTPISGNIQSAARDARYALLDDWAGAEGCGWIATAHHGDDQLETMLMRLARGSGVSGLAAIRARNGKIIRPLLDFGKAELEAICVRAGVSPVRDPSNDNADFDRVAMRRWLAASDHDFDLERANRSAAALADAAEALDWMAARLATQHIGSEREIVTVTYSGLPRELQRRLLLLALHRVDADANPRADAIDRALDQLPKGDVITLGNVLCTGGDVWRLSAAPPRRTG